MKWFSIKGILEEIKTIEWASGKKVFMSAVSVLLFSSLFMVFFVFFDTISAYIMKTFGA